MHRFGCWSLYSKFGYHKEGDPSYKNICEITQDVFDLYGEGDPLVVGMFSDGDSGWKNSGDEKSPLFVNEFLIKGGENTLGYPFKDEDDKGEGGSIYVHKWPDDSGTNNVIIQNFKNYGPNKYGTDGETALIYNRGQGKCWLLKEGFWGLYKPSKSTNDPSREYLTFLFGPHDLGAPTSDELIDNKTGETVQKFDRGELRFKAKWFGRDKYSILWYNNPPNGRLANQEYQLVPS